VPRGLSNSRFKMCATDPAPPRSDCANTLAGLLKGQGAAQCDNGLALSCLKYARFVLGFKPFEALAVRSRMPLALTAHYR
jgi:hypothetical protein